ncbi:N-acetylglucosamine-6-phosphate deacetylase [Clostridium sp. NSJ-6]|uniref:N-acetylglucosamine-6-phosphate deacetylase n=1 Tax=Clostridium hominis TaxID=2763036 RepID=A0ABR7DE09_9CLOT|nr:N-acetylglucosamine-6-phosphate deacetylase [Clostridium hominis]MBC5629631.1 N-acetylglucosamine-6-phosphate deacetylase [Clostridium hominis]
MSSLIITNGKILVGKEYVEGNLEIINGAISRIGDFQVDRNKLKVIDANGQVVVPGFIDIHTHGGNGIDINHASKDDLNKLSKFFASCGVTSFLPAILTDTHETMCKLLSEIADAKEEGTDGSEILGIHMEGPFLCVQYKGAMPEYLIQDSSIENIKDYINSSKNNIKYMTISPENKGVEELVAYLRENNIVASMGHTGADYNKCLSCINAGVTSSTHVFNAMGTLHQHRPSAIGAALESDIYSEIICDGFHLHPGIVRLIIKVKGDEKILAITDSIMAAGLSDGEYKLGVNDIVVKEGDAQLVSDGTRAGSTLTMDRALINLIKFTGRKLEDVIRFLTKNQANVLGLDNKGEIAVGKDGDIVILDNKLTPICTVVKGKIVYER